MNKTQFKCIAEYCRPFYTATGRWHAWDHVYAVMNIATEIAKTEYPEVNMYCVKSAALLHDMGRVIKDEGHASESGRIAEPYLKSVGIDSHEIDIILDAVTNHDVKKIEQSKYTEARIVYDADKIEILSVYGFWRVTYWLVEERKMELGEAINFLDDYCKRFKKTLYSNYAKELASKEYPVIDEMIKKFNSYEKSWRVTIDT